MTWIWGFDDAHGRWYHAAPGRMTRRKADAMRYTERYFALSQMRGHRRYWGRAGREHVLIKLTKRSNG